MAEIEDVIQPISRGNNVIIIDVNEQRSGILHSKSSASQAQSFIIFDMETRLIIDSFVLEPSDNLQKSCRPSLQFECVSDRIFIIEKVDQL